MRLKRCYKPDDKCLGFPAIIFMGLLSFNMIRWWAEVNCVMPMILTSYTLLCQFFFSLTGNSSSQEFARLVAFVRQDCAFRKTKDFAWEKSKS